MTDPQRRTCRRCRTCGGTGRIWSLRSWYRADGFTRSRCGYCEGTGFSTYPGPDARYVRFQAEAREATIRVQEKSA